MSQNTVHTSRARSSRRRDLRVKRRELHRLGDPGPHLREPRGAVVALEDVDAPVHLAGLPPGSGRLGEPRKTRRTEQQGRGRNRGPKKIQWSLYTSSI